ncbi:hypothetical protein DFH09DRAFT_1192196 [Mycena vulgaris]|nr:hypothetical protein DFH09DRAFT_1192196 [Mycena vulgaris]
MKSFQTLATAVFALATFSFANAAVTTAVTSTITARPTGANTSSIASNGTSHFTTSVTTVHNATITARPTGGNTSTIAANGTSIFTTFTTSSAPANATGGFVVAGIYTTCLELTFAVPNGTVNGTATANFTRSAFPTASANFTSTAGDHFTIFPNATATAFPTGSPNGTAVSSAFPEAVTVFTTCLVFLPENTGTVSGFNSSATAGPSAVLNATNTAVQAKATS